MNISFPEWLVRVRRILAYLRKSATEEGLQKQIRFFSKENK